MIGQLLDGKYEVLRLIGEGGMGAVYEARNQDTGERCAVKVINDEAVAKDEVLIQRFEREAYAAKKVLSPNIVEILAAGHDDATGHPYMVMEMLDGENALQVLKRIGPMPPQLALRVGIQTCEGLAKAHDAGVVHRDIKPANLFVAELPNDEHVVKLLDFGVAKFKMDQASESDNESLTRTGSMLGSPMYMSPEQARGLKTIDHRADIWSLGIVMHQLLAGRVPHQDIDGLGELIITICSEPPPHVSETAPWVSPRISEVIAGALKLSTAERYQTAHDFGEAMRRCLEGDDETIQTSMFERLTDEEKNTRPQAPEEKKQEAAAAAASGGFVALDSTVALEDVEEAMRMAQAARQNKESEPPATQALPTAGGGQADTNLAATMAFPMEDFELPSDLSAAIANNAAASRGAAAPAASPAPATSSTSSSTAARRDERALAKHREAQRAAIDAARLGPAEEPKGGSGRVILAIIAGVLLGGGGLAAYYFKVKANGSTVPTAVSSAPPAPPAPSPAPTPEVSAAPAPTPSTSASAAAATGQHKLKVSPPYAIFMVDGKRMTPDNGFITLEGAPGATHQIRVTLGAQVQTVTVKLTEEGPEPSEITLAPKAAAPPAPPTAPGKAPRPKPRATP